MDLGTPNIFSGDGSTPAPVEYSPHDTALLIVSGPENLRPLEATLPPSGPVAFFSRTFIFIIATMALPFSVTDTKSGSTTASPFSVTDDNSGFTTAILFSVTDANSGSTTTTAFSATDVNSGSTTALPSNETEAHPGSTTALPLNTIDTNSDSGTSPASIDPDPARSIVSRAHNNDVPGLPLLHHFP